MAEEIKIIQADRDAAFARELAMAPLCFPEAARWALEENEALRRMLDAASKERV